MNDIVKSFTTDLAKANEMGLAMRAHASSIQVNTGQTFLKLDSEGWNYGADQTPIEEGTEWVINPMSVKHGWIKFPPDEAANRSPEVLSVSIFDERPTPPDSGFSDYLEIELAQISEGEDFGKKVVYTGGTVGARAAIQPIIEALSARMIEGNPEMFPIATLDMDDYWHNRWKRTVYVPIITVDEWMGSEELAEIFADGGGDEAAAKAAAPKKKAAPKKAAAPKEEAPKKRAPRRSKKAEEPVAEEAEAEAEAEAEPEAVSEPAEASEEDNAPVRRKRRARR